MAIIDQDRSGVSRSKLLTNSAAEFIETRSEETLGLQTTKDGLEFVPELDRFSAKTYQTKSVNRDSYGRRGSLTDNRVNYYKESEDKAKELKDILKSFCNLVETRKLDKKLGFAIKHPETYCMDDVLHVAEALWEQHRSSDQLQSSLGFIRKSFRIGASGRSVIQTLLTFVPSDFYGSVICGGFTIALCVSEPWQQTAIWSFGSYTETLTPSQGPRTRRLA